jgi:hypothetical protein
LIGIDNVNGYAKINFDDFTLSDLDPKDKFELIQENDENYLLAFSRVSSSNPGIVFEVVKNGTITKEYNNYHTLDGKFVMAGSIYDANSKMLMLNA